MTGRFSRRSGRIWWSRGGLRVRLRRCLSGRIEALVGRIEELFGSLDASLRFQAERVTQAAEADEAEEESHVIDLRRVQCPLNFVKAKIELEKIAVGGVREVLLDGGEPVRNVPESFSGQGQEVLETKKRGDHYCLRVRRVK